jgi:hypothetical protein
VIIIYMILMTEGAELPEKYKQNYHFDTSEGVTCIVEEHKNDIKISCMYQESYLLSDKFGFTKSEAIEHIQECFEPIAEEVLENPEDIIKDELRAKQDRMAQSGGNNPDHPIRDRYRNLMQAVTMVNIQQRERKDHE